MPRYRFKFTASTTANGESLLAAPAQLNTTIARPKIVTNFFNVDSFLKFE
jgi:hypothetical protein